MTFILFLLKEKKLQGYVDNELIAMTAFSGYLQAPLASRIGWHQRCLDIPGRRQYFQGYKVFHETVRTTARSSHDRQGNERTSKQARSTNRVPKREKKNNKPESMLAPVSNSFHTTSRHCRSLDREKSDSKEEAKEAHSVHSHKSSKSPVAPIAPSAPKLSAAPSEYTQWPGVADADPRRVL